jgi:hypothetical protein
VNPEGVMELAAEYRLDKIKADLAQPYKFINSQNGEVNQDTFEYFPQHHYEKSIDEYREDIDDPNLNHLIDYLLESRITGAEASGIWKDNVPGFVDELLENDRREEIKIEIYPEPSPHQHDYVVDWEYVDWDWNEETWKPVDSFERGDL